MHGLGILFGIPHLRAATCLLRAVGPRRTALLRGEITIRRKLKMASVLLTLVFVRLELNVNNQSTADVGHRRKMLLGNAEALHFTPSLSRRSISSAGINVRRPMRRSLIFSAASNR